MVQKKAVQHSYNTSCHAIQQHVLPNPAATTARITTLCIPSNLAIRPIRVHGEHASSSSFASPASPQNHTALCRHLSIMPKECSQKANCSIHGDNSSDPDERICGIVQICPSCSDDQSLVTKLKLETDLEKHEGDGMFTNRHLQHFMDNFVEVLASESRECLSK